MIYLAGASEGRHVYAFGEVGDRVKTVVAKKDVRRRDW